jgi:hypothetical protein
MTTNSASAIEQALANYMTEDQAAAALGRTRRTLREWRKQETGPPYIKHIKLVLYPVDGFAAWLKSLERQA